MTFEQDAQDRDGRAQPAQDRPRRRARDVLVRKDMPFDAAVAAQWLHGAPAANLKFDVSVRLVAAADPVRPLSRTTASTTRPASSRARRSKWPRGRSTPQGRASARIDIAPQQPSPGMLDAAFTSRVFEESGDFSVDTFSLPVPPLRFLRRRPGAQGRPGPGACS